MAIVIASPRAESWGVAGVVRPGFCVSFTLSKNRGKINHAEPGDFPRSHRSLGQSVRGSKASRQALPSEFVDGTRIAILQQPGNPAHPIFIDEIQPIANSLKLTYRIFEARRSEDFECSFALMREWPADAVIVLDDSCYTESRNPWPRR